MAADYELELIQGETYERTYRWKVDGVAQNLASWTPRAEVRLKEDMNSLRLLDLDQYMTKEVSDTPGVLDRIRLVVPATITRALTPKQFKVAAWDLFLVRTADPTDAFCLVQGAATCDPAATNTGVA